MVQLLVKFAALTSAVMASVGEEEKVVDKPIVDKHESGIEIDINVGAQTRKYREFLPDWAQLGFRKMAKRYPPACDLRYYKVVNWDIAYNLKLFIEGKTEKTSATEVFQFYIKNISKQIYTRLNVIRNPRGSDLVTRTPEVIPERDFELIVGAITSAAKEINKMNKTRNTMIDKIKFKKRFTDSIDDEEPLDTDINAENATDAFVQLAHGGKCFKGLEMKTLSQDEFRTKVRRWISDSLLFHSSLTDEQSASCASSQSYVLSPEDCKMPIPPQEGKRSSGDSMSSSNSEIFD